MALIDATAAIEGLEALGLTIPGVETVYIGSPEAGETRTGMWIMLGDPEDISDAETGILQVRFNLITHYHYVIESAERAAELALTDWWSEIVERVARNRGETVDGVTPRLNGSVTRLELPRSAAGTSDYALMAGVENRLYPLAIPVVQKVNLGV